MTSPTEKRNVRKPGRGLRPYLLIPKVISVCVYFGASVSAAVLWHVFVGCRNIDGIDAAMLSHQIESVKLLIVFVAVPALLLALILGVFLILQHPKAMLKMRWVRLKLLLLFFGIPVFHVFMASRLHHFREQLESGIINISLRNQLNIGFTLLLIWSAVLIWLGRHKPRLWQNWAKSFQALKN